MNALATDRPLTIPALRDWQPTSAEFLFTAASRLVIESDELRETADVLAEDLKKLFGSLIEVVNDLKAQSGDIVLRVSAVDTALGCEGYQLSIGPLVIISAPSLKGIFYGSRTLLQLLTQDHRVGGGVCRDWPRYPDRGMMVDIARKFFSREWFESHIFELAYLKMNLLHLHISDDAGFGIESNTLGLPAARDRLSKGDIQHILALASKYHIVVVPEIDMPGHMGAALKCRSEFGLENVFGLHAKNVLDVTNSAAVAFAKDLVREYLELFTGSYWHLGGDEVLPALTYAAYPQLDSYAKKQFGSAANGKDMFHWFINEINQLVQSTGRITRVWNDDLGGGSQIKINPRIIVEWWTDFSILSSWHPPTPQQLLDSGHQVMNCGWWPTYYVPGRVLPPTPDVNSAYESWAVHDFYGPLYLTKNLQSCPHSVDAREPTNRGAKLNIWGDNASAETVEELTANISNRLRVLSQKTWASTPLAPSFETFLQIIEAVKHAPGYTK